MYASVAAAVEAQAGVAGAHEIHAYATQVVAGTNFFVKVWLFCPRTQMLIIIVSRKNSIVDIVLFTVLY